MSKKLLIASSIALSSLFIPLTLQAAETNTPVTTPATGTDSTPKEMTKDAWLGAMAPMLPPMICKGFMDDADLKKRFEDIKMTYDQCVSLVPESAKKCQDQIYAQIPDKINGDNAPVWGRTLGECIGKDFAEKYLVPKS